MELFGNPYSNRSIKIVVRVMNLILQRMRKLSLLYRKLNTFVGYKKIF